MVKKVFFPLFLVLFVLICIEIFSYISLCYIYGSFYKTIFIRSEQELVLSNDKVEAQQLIQLETRHEDYIRMMVLHPYLGFVFGNERTSPQKKTNSSKNKQKNGINKRTKADFNEAKQFGFSGSGCPKIFHTRSDDHCIIAIFGGSVAQNFADLGSGRLHHLLAECPSFQNREIFILNLAIGGYKQPQQLLALNWLFSLGAEFDIVINIDGLNELALPVIENIPKKVFPFFPRNWFYYTQKAADPYILEKIGHIYYLDNQRTEYTRFLDDSLFHYSLTLQLIWKLYSRSIDERINHDRHELVGFQSDLNHFQVTGPTYDQNGYQFYRDAAAIWKRCSMQMSQLCSARKTAYFHFLQPNQYVRNSKPFSTEEKEKMINNVSGFNKAVTIGYPMLIKSGLDLSQNGISFFDLTSVFSSIEDTLYIDDCCHFNALGNEIMAEEIARLICE